MVKKALKYYSSLSLFTKFVSTSFVIFAAFLISVKLFPFLTLHEIGLILPTGQDIGPFLGKIITLWFIAFFLLSAIYLIIGIVRLISEKTKKIKKPQTRKAGSMIIKGIIGMAISLLLYFGFSYILGLWGSPPVQLNLPPSFYQPSVIPSK